MNGDPSGPSDFFDVACRLQLLSGDSGELRTEASRAGLSPAELVLRRGLLDTIEVDIVETLRHPRRTIPGYEILDVIGRGAMGVVYRAQQENLERIVALKTVLVSQMADKAASDRFLLEGRTVGRLRHPNIVAAYDLGRHEGRLFLAMEYVEGIDLEQRLRRLGQLDEMSTWHIARQTAGGLAQAAGLGIVHRDVKPANLMLVDPPAGYPLPSGVPMVKVADFGLAFLMQDAEASVRLTMENTTVGSPYYMAPEQFESSAVGIPADIYALGATVYHALAGRPPFHGLTVPQIISAKMQRDPDDLRNVRPGLNEGTYQLVDQLLIRNPEQRIADYETLIERIDLLVGNPTQTTRLPAARQVDPGEATLIDTVRDQPVSRKTAGATDEFPAAATTEHRSVHFDKTSRRRFPWWPFAVVGLLAAVGLGLWFLWPPGEKPEPLPVRVPMEQVGSMEHLFNGTNIRGWQHRSGNWVVPPTFPVLEGTNGVIGRPLFRANEESGPLAPAVVPRRHYRVEISLQPFAEGRDGAQEVHFGLVADESHDGWRYVVRRTPEGVQLGTRDSDDALFTPSEAHAVQPAHPDDVLPITVERLPTGWFVDLGDGKFVPLRASDRELPEFRLAADGGTVWFSDLIVVDLRPQG